MQITASLVKELRARTNGGMMDCKRALEEAGGDIDAAADILRKKGLSKAEKKAGRIAAEGTIRVLVASDRQTAVIVDVNCETDFVAREAAFTQFADDVSQAALSGKLSSIDAVNQAVNSKGETFEHVRHELVSKLGENIQIRRLKFVEAQGALFSYRHGERIGVLIDVSKNDEGLGKDLAMHIAASSPTAISPQDVSQEEIDKEREIFTAQALESGKPAEIVEKMIEGRIKKFLAEKSLLGQPFVKDPSTSVEDLLKSSGATVHYFDRFEVGEGIEKKQDDFADEVMAQVRGKE